MKRISALSASKHLNGWVGFLRDFKRKRPNSLCILHTYFGFLTKQSKISLNLSHALA